MGAPRDLPYQRRTWNRATARLLGTTLTPLVLATGGVFVMASGVTPSTLRWLVAGLGAASALLVVSTVHRVVGDLTDRLERRDVRLKMLERRMRETSRLASTRQIGLLLAARLRDRLAGISSQLALSGAPTPDTPPPAELIRSLRWNVEACTDLVSRYTKLTVVRDDPVPDLPLDLEGLIDDVLALLEWETYLRHIKIIRERRSPRPRVLGDRARLRLILQHLLLNAVQAVDRFGSIRVIMADTERTVQLTIVDSGPGIAPDDLERVFEPLFTTRSEGVGLGLSVCRELAAGMGASVTADNAPHGGAAFTVHLRAETPKRLPDRL